MTNHPIARSHGARYADACNPDRFYRLALPGEAHGVYVLDFQGGQPGKWRQSHYYHLPETAIPVGRRVDSPGEAGNRRAKL